MYCNPFYFYDFIKPFDPFGIMRAYSEVSMAWFSQPFELANHSYQFAQSYTNITVQTWQRFLGIDQDDTIVPCEYDARFQDPIWFNNPISDFIKEHYLLVTRWSEDLIYATPNVDAKTKHTCAFWHRQTCNALAPTNFFWLNPQALNECVKSGGKSIQQGAELFFEDMQANTVGMVNKKEFNVGKNLAITSGQVVYRNELFELIQYYPKTKTVSEIPILIVPPWINKYYILDLTPKKSLINYLVEQGFSVFVISWKNPSPKMANTNFDDFLFKGILEATNQTKALTNVEQIHACGYCIGGTALSTLMAWLNANPETKENPPIAHWSLLCSLVDFENPGDISLFINEESVSMIEKIMQSQGYLSGEQMQHTFRLLRSNSLIWHYAVQQYLLGQKADAFDILFWNTDNTRLPEAMHSYYLREFYLNNNLVKPNALKFKNVPVNLKNIQQPLYCVGTEQDHITPWQETFKICQYINAPVRYTLATSGHIVGILSPPVTPPKRRYWTGDVRQTNNPLAWLNQQEKHLGSWWQDWSQWLSNHCGAQQDTPKLEYQHNPALPKAPGNYVLEK